MTFFTPLADKFLSAPLINGYSGTWMMVIFLMAYGYVGWPIGPDAQVGSKVYEIIGKPTFQDSTGAKLSTEYFAVNGLRLNSDFGLFGGMGGYGLLRGAVDLKKPVRATYFWRPTRLWFRDRMLYALEQEGRQIVSAQQLHAERVQSYERGWKVYYQLHVFLALVTLILWFIERSIQKRNKTQLFKE